MRIGFVPEDEIEDDEVIELLPGLANVVEPETEDSGLDNLMYFALQVGLFTIEWRLHR